MKFTVTRLPLAAACGVANARRACGPGCALRLACRAAGQPLASDLTDSVYWAWTPCCCPSPKASPGPPAPRPVLPPCSAGQRGHFGHSLGRDTFCEMPPFIAAEAHVPIEPGMVLAFETPVYVDGEGGFIIEDQFLITEQGARSLPRQLLAVR